MYPRCKARHTGLSVGGRHRKERFGPFAGGEMRLEEGIVVEVALGLVGEDSAGNARSAENCGAGSTARVLLPGRDECRHATRAQFGVGKGGHAATSVSTLLAWNTRPHPNSRSTMDHLLLP